MVRLRPYKLSDGEYIINWIKDEFSFTQWCADKFQYPITKEQLDNYYHMYEEDDNGWLMSAIDKDGKVIGHLLMRMANYEQESIHFGFIIIDKELRGLGLGKEMVLLATEYAFNILGVNRITLVVFKNNPVAHKIYKSIGFVDVEFVDDTIPNKKEKWGIYKMELVKNSVTTN